MNIAICDDDIKAVGQMEKLVATCFEGDTGGYSCDTFLSGDEMLSYQKETGKRYQIYIMDIEMPGKSGIEVAEILRETDHEDLIIFTTSHCEMMQEAFDVVAYHYLIKPIDEQKAIHVITRGLDHLREKERVFQFKSGKKTITINYSDILYFESQKRKLLLYKFNESFEFYGTLKEILATVRQDYFAQVHNSYVVNMSRVETLDKDEVVLQNGIRVPISKTYYQSFNAAYRNYMKKRMGKK